MRRSIRIDVCQPCRRDRLPWAPLGFLASSVLLVAVLHRSFSFFDLKVYRQAAGLVLGGRPLYAARFGRGLGFTYPPIAAIVFGPLRICSVRDDEVAVTLVNLALVAVFAHLTMRLGGSAAGDARQSRAAWLASAAAVWIWPVTSALGYGQIDLLIAALVLADLTFGRDARWGGLLVGAAAALKLTPLIFIAYLALSGRPGMAVRAVGAFALSIAAAFAVCPGDASSYWTGGVLDTSHITGGGYTAGRGPANQSLHGALLRVAPGLSHHPVIWLAACAIVGFVGVVLAVSAARRGDERWGFASTAVTGLLICPISWVHHWVIALAGLLLLATGPRRSAARSIRSAIAVVAAAGSWSIKPVIAAHPAAEHLGTFGLLVGNLYVIAGLLTLLTAAVIECSARRSRDRHPPLNASKRTDQTPAAERAREPQLALAATSGHSAHLSAGTPDDRSCDMVRAPGL